MRLHGHRIVVLLAGLWLMPAVTHAQTMTEQMQAVTPALSADKPVTMEADELGYDQKNGIVIARGHVVVSQENTVLNADGVTYYQQRDLVVARGNISMLQPSGDVFFADTVQLTDDMKRGVIEQFRARLSDNSVFAAASAEKKGAGVTMLKKAVYSPCRLCEDAAPFWQMKAGEIEIDEYDERVRYKNTRLEMFGVPIFYTPFFYHPTPDAEARSGFLPPRYSHDSNLGTMVEIPYYWRIGHSSEVVLTPWYMSDEGLLLEEDYKQLTDGGSYRIRGSLTDAKNRDAAGDRIAGRQWRGHIYGDGSESITDYSRIGFNIDRASDDTYLRRYGFGSQRTLFSEVFFEAAQARNFALMRGLAIQGLRLTDDPEQTPLVLPTIEGYYETDPMDSGLRFHFFGNAQSITRDIGADQKRLVAMAGAEIPYVSDGGHVFTGTLNLRQDLYSVNDVLQPDASLFSGEKSRTVPQAALEWRYPLIRQFEAGDALTIEPIVLGVWQPNAGNPTEINNEDNTLIELNDTNLFSLNRMPGYDTVDAGPRVAYGARGQYLFVGGESMEWMLGQDYNADSDTPFPNSTTPGSNFSDYIGSLSFSASPIDLSYRFAFNNDSVEANRTEIIAGFSRPWLGLTGAYRELKNNQYLPDSREAILNGNLPLTDAWTLYGGGRRDLELDQMVASAGGLLYRNECFNMMLQAARNYTRDRDIEPSTSFTFRVGFKNLGEFGDE